MTRHVCLFLALCLCAGLPAKAQLPGQSAQQAAYVSPYQFAASVTDPALTPDFREEPKALTNWRNWSETPYRDWHDFRVIERLHSTWGPYYINFRAPAGVLARPADWLQKRIIAAASVVRNTAPYGHHHMAQWSVPDEPRWTEHRYEPGYGFDCSDFTHFAYSYGLGIQLKTGIREQADLTRAPIHFADGATGEVRAHRLFDVQNGYTKTYADLVKQLQPGDLLYIRSNAALTHPISHVIMWIGNLAHDTTGQDKYLVMDSHGAVVKDSRGALIPSGPELRPFREDSYYFRSFDHVVRYVPLERK
jgi:cell wall-associated NlpC family hydrolase